MPPTSADLVMHCSRKGSARTGWTRANCAIVEPLAATGALGGLLIDTHGFIGVPEFTDALAAAAMRAGARFAMDTRVVAIAPTADKRVVVTTATGPSVADRVILAAGSWAGQIRIDGLADCVAVKPVRGQLLHLAWPTSQPLRHVLWGTDCYIVPWLNGRVTGRGDGRRRGLR